MTRVEKLKLRPRVATAPEPGIVVDLRRPDLATLASSAPRLEFLDRLLIIRELRRELLLW